MTIDEHDVYDKVACQYFRKHKERLKELKVLPLLRKKLNVSVKVKKIRKNELT
jgi:hypothetical protein